MIVNYVIIPQHKFCVRSEAVDAVETSITKDPNTGKENYVISLYSKSFPTPKEFVYNSMDAANIAIDYISECIGVTNLNPLHLRDTLPATNSTNQTKEDSSEPQVTIHHAKQEVKPQPETKPTAQEKSNEDVPVDKYHKRNFTIYSFDNNPEGIILKYQDTQIKIDDIIAIKIKSNPRSIYVLAKGKSYSTMFSDKKSFNNVVGTLYKELAKSNKLFAFSDSARTLIHNDQITSFIVDDNNDHGSIIKIGIKDNSILISGNIKLYYKNSINEKNGEAIRTDIERLVTYGIREGSDKELASESKTETPVSSENTANANAVKSFTCNDSAKTEIDLNCVEAFASFRNPYTQYIMVRVKGGTTKLFYTHDTSTCYMGDTKRFEDAGIQKLSWREYLKRYPEV